MNRYGAPFSGTIPGPSTLLDDPDPVVAVRPDGRVRRSKAALQAQGPRSRYWLDRWDTARRKMSSRCGPASGSPAGGGAMMTAHGATHVGHVRKTNEDHVLVDLDLGLFLVADGMGGHTAGEVASRVTVDTIHAFIARSQDGGKCTCRSVSTRTPTGRCCPGAGR